MRGIQDDTVGLIEGALDIFRSDLPLATFGQLPRLQAYTSVEPEQIGNIADPGYVGRMPVSP